MSSKKKKSSRRVRRARNQGLRVCEFPECGRPAYAHGLCQTHDRQKRNGQALRPIRRYRPRVTGTQKFAGLRLSALCSDQIDEFAEENGLSRTAAISEILERWNPRRPKPKPAAP